MSPDQFSKGRHKHFWFPYNIATRKLTYGNILTGKPRDRHGKNFGFPVGFPLNWNHQLPITSPFSYGFPTFFFPRSYLKSSGPSAARLRHWRLHRRSCWRDGRGQRRSSNWAPVRVWGGNSSSIYTVHMYIYTHIYIYTYVYRYIYIGIFLDLLMMICYFPIGKSTT